MQKKDRIKTYGTVLLGSAVFALGFDLFLQPNNINAGGLSGLSLILTTVLGWGSVGVFTAFLNVPLFLVGYRRLGREFFLRSLVGMLASAFFLEVFSHLPFPKTEPFLGALAGGLMSGTGMGWVFLNGGTTGGADIIARLLKEKLPNLSMGRLIFFVDVVVVTLTGLVFRDLNKALYSAVTMYVASIMVDKLIYGGDATAVALIVSEKHTQIAKRIGESLHRGVTVLSGQGYHTGKERPVLLTAIRKNQVKAIKDLVLTLDPDAFLILQEAHQILGTGFRRYSKDDIL